MYNENKRKQWMLAIHFHTTSKDKKKVHSVCAQVYSFMTLSTGDVRKLNKNDESGREI